MVIQPTSKRYKLTKGDFEVHYKDKLIQLIGSPELLEHLAIDYHKHTQYLVKQIKSDYLLLMGKRLNISNRSLMAEIWGHMYASYLADALKELVRLKLIENLTEIVKHRSDTIDCGETEIDSNRKFWDFVSRFNSIIIKFLPKSSLDKNENLN